MFYAAHFKVNSILKFRRKKSDESYVSTYLCLEKIWVYFEYLETFNTFQQKMSVPFIFFVNWSKK